MTLRTIGIASFGVGILIGAMAGCPQPARASTLFQSVSDFTVAPLGYFTGDLSDVFTLASKSTITSITVALGGADPPPTVNVLILHSNTNLPLAPVLFNQNLPASPVQSIPQVSNTTQIVSLVPIDFLQFVPGQGLVLAPLTLDPGTYNIAFGNVTAPAFAQTGGTMSKNALGGNDQFPNPSGVSLGFILEGDVVASAATPLPAALPLFASGLGALGLLGWRKKRKASAALAA